MMMLSNKRTYKRRLNYLIREKKHFIMNEFKSIQFRQLIEDEGFQALIVTLIFICIIILFVLHVNM